MTIRTTAVVLLLTGCLPTGSAGRSSGLDGCAQCTEPAPPDRDESCLADVPSSEVNPDLQSIDETGESYHEMVACGGLAFQASRDLTQILVSSLLEAQGVHLPGGFEYDGEGGYRSGSAGTDMVVRYFYGDSFTAGAEDELVTHNLYDFDNYLRATQVVPTFDGVDVHWNQAGPLVELLGHGTEPPNPLHLTLDDLAMPYRIGRLKVVTEVEVVSTTANATVRYTLASEPRRIRPMLDEGAMDIDQLSSTTINANGSTLVSTTWGVGYNDTAGVLNGAIDFALSGSVQLVGRYAFDESSTPVISWTCQPGTDG